MKIISHPGETIKVLYFEPLNVSQATFGKMVGIDQRTVSKLLAGKIPITTTLATKLERSIGDTAASWLLQQQWYDLAQQRKTND